MCPIGEEYHHGEVVTNNELADSSDDKEHPTEPDVDGSRCDRETSRTLPAYYENCQSPFAMK